MNFVADESVDGPIVLGVRREGHSVLYVAEMDPGIKDDAVLRLALEQNAVLITGDKDFGELVFRQKRATAGVILVRLDGLTADLKVHMVVAALQDHGSDMAGAFTVISAGNVRIRRAL